jgi:hypothetical protein
MESFIETISGAMKEIKETFDSAPPAPVVKRRPAGAADEAEAKKRRQDDSSKLPPTDPDTKETPDARRQP